jgi:uncharacterized damage-inducible protein DinB
MSRFQGQGALTPSLATTLFEDFAALRSARVEEDRGIEEWFSSAPGEFYSGTLEYVNNQGKAYREKVPVAVSHLFNHQTHHRGQIHVMLSQTAVKAPSLDLHRIINP